VGRQLDITLPMEPYAPLRARHAIAGVDSPSPDLRDVVVLLVSELVTNSVRHAAPEGGEEIRLRAWMPPHVVRVEVHDDGPGPTEEEVRDGRGYGMQMLDDLADRWGIDRAEAATQVWFEIDR
jgi:two-component sensor histidine kinase